MVTGFYEIHEKDAGWLHALEIQDGDRRIVIEDDTDNVTAYANVPVDAKEIAGIWLKHRMGTGSFVHKATFEFGFRRFRNAPNLDGVSIVWSGSGVELSHLV